MRFLLICECEVFPMKWKLCILAFILVFILSACNTEETPTIQTKPDSQPQLYEILNENGVYYLKYSDYALEQFDAQLDELSKHPLLKRKYEYPQYPSAIDMKQAIENHELSFVQLLNIYYVTHRVSPLKIIDPDFICDIVYPENLQLDEIRWYGYFYVFDLSDSSNSSITANLFVHNNSRYQEIFDSYYTDPKSNIAAQRSQLISKGEIPDRDAYEIVYTKNAEQITYKEILYQLQDKSKTIYINEFYKLKDHITNDFISSTIPYQTRIFVEDGEKKFYANIHNYEARPTTDWLLSFGFASEDTPDYGEFFQESLTMDGGPAEAYAIETKKLFDSDPAAFITTLNQENEQIQNRVLPYLIAETRTDSLAKLADHFAAYKDDPEYTGLLSIFDTHLNRWLSYEPSKLSVPPETVQGYAFDPEIIKKFIDLDLELGGNDEEYKRTIANAYLSDPILLAELILDYPKDKIEMIVESICAGLKLQNKTPLTVNDSKLDTDMLHIFSQIQEKYESK